MATRARRAVLAVSAGCAACLCACTLLVGVPDHLTGGGTSGDASSDGPAPEGPAPEAARGDDASDSGSTSDGPIVVGDTGPPDGSTGPYPPGSWCAMQPSQGLILCDDFDHDTLAFPRWTRQVFGIGGTTGFSPTHVSAPYSLEIDVPPHMATTFDLEVLEEDVPGSVRAGSLSFDFQFQPQAWPDAGADAAAPMMYIASISQGPGSPRVAVTMFTGPGGTQLQEQDTDSNGNDTFNNSQWTSYVPQSGRFTEVTLSIVFGETVTASLVAGGMNLGNLPLAGDWQPTTTTTVYLGNWYVTTTPGFQLLYDDVTVRQQ